MCFSVSFTEIYFAMKNVCIVQTFESELQPYFSHLGLVLAAERVFFSLHKVRLYCKVYCVYTEQWTVHIWVCTVCVQWTVHIWVWPARSGAARETMFSQKQPLSSSPPARSGSGSLNFHEIFIGLFSFQKISHLFELNSKNTTCKKTLQNIFCDHWAKQAVYAIDLNHSHQLASKEKRNKFSGGIYHSADQFISQSSW